MKKIFIVILSLFLLSSCSADENKELENFFSTKEYSTRTYFMGNQKLNFSYLAYDENDDILK